MPKTAEQVLQEHIGSLVIRCASLEAALSEALEQIAASAAKNNPALNQLQHESGQSQPVPEMFASSRNVSNASIPRGSSGNS